MSMFCFQCEQTAKGTGCTVNGVCEKRADTAKLIALAAAAKAAPSEETDLSGHGPH